MHIACIYLSLQCLMALTKFRLISSRMFLNVLLDWVIKEEGQKHPGCN